MVSVVLPPCLDGSESHALYNRRVAGALRLLVHVSLLCATDAAEETPFSELWQRESLVLPGLTLYYWFYALWLSYGSVVRLSRTW